MAEFLRYMSDIQLDNARFIFQFFKKKDGQMKPLLECSETYMLNLE